MVLDPAQAGSVSLHLDTSAPTARLDVPEVDATMAQPSAGITDLTVPVQKPAKRSATNGRRGALKGTWTLNVTVRTTEFDEFATPVKVRIR